ncbi:hypothetical protein [Shewanella sp. Shew256]|uniref:hypothetical protein n=1 Tax=Shewanella sp. Shew256 TaxID=1969376 RepID=UPI000B499726|nr:hypothetical protein [Shewanella sp. Shew256]
MFTNGNAKFLFLVLLSVGIFGEFWEWMDEWASHEAPYRYAAAFYHFTFQELLRVFPLIKNAVAGSGITPFQNLNWVLGIILMLVAIGGSIKGGVIAHRYLVDKQVHKKVYYGYLAPFALSCVLFMGSIATSWLFA